MAKSEKVVWENKGRTVLIRGYDRKGAYLDVIRVCHELAVTYGSAASAAAYLIRQTKEYKKLVAANPKLTKITPEEKGAKRPPTSRPSRASRTKKETSSSTTGTKTGGSGSRPTRRKRRARV